MRFGITMQGLMIGSRMNKNPLVIPEGSIVKIYNENREMHYIDILWEGTMITMSESWPIAIKPLAGAEAELARLLWE